MIIESFKNFYFKKSYDYDDPDISLFHFHPQLRIYFIINGIFFNNKDSLVRLILPVLNTLMSLIAFAFEVIFVCRGVLIEDYSFASECFCYIVILGTVPIVYMSIIGHRDVIMKQLDDMSDDFIKILKKDPKSKQVFFDGQLLIWKMCWVWQIFCLSVSVLFIGNTFSILLYESLLVTQDEYYVRPLIFPMWLPEDDPYRTPNYEIFMFFQIVLIYVIEQNFCAYVYLQFHILLHYYTSMDIIILDLEVVFDGLDESVVSLPKHDPLRKEVVHKLNKRFGAIVDRHMSVIRCVQRVSSVFGPPLVYQTMFSSLGICLMAYQVVSELENNRIDYLFAAVLVAGCIQVWIPCYLGTLIRDKAFLVGDACWNCGWHKTSLGRLVLPDILLMILRSQKQLTIQFTALPPLTLETFSSIMSTSYSYFNMLRQVTK